MTATLHIDRKLSIAIILGNTMAWADFALYGIFLAPVSAVLPAALAELFPFEVRCTAGALGYNAALVKKPKTLISVPDMNWLYYYILAF